MWRIGAIPYRDKGLQYLPLGYLRGLKHIGASPVMLRYETPLEEVPAIVRRLDGILFTGGVDIEPGVYGAYR
ncbi:MAG: gamma-glutamyl-gamma-aminobutyrate hydrolase family protein, partial [Clostridiales bacterium]|nr:gamma-glutamyl-gamma-aminobutyrate hydrolase family protein [Clostridiales bacterium]